MTSFPEAGPRQPEEHPVEEPGAAHPVPEARIRALLDEDRIEVEFRSSRKEEAAAASELELARYPRWISRGLVPGVLVCVGLVALLPIIGGDFGVIEYALTGAGMGLLLGMAHQLLNRRLGPDRWARRIALSSDGLREEPSFRPLTPWSRIRSVRETEGFFLFTTGFARGFHSLPKRVLSDGEIERVRALILQNAWEPENAKLLTPASVDEDRRIER